MAANIPRNIKIFVAWPSDVEEERNRVEEVIDNLHEVYLPRGCYLEMLDWRKSVPPGAGNPEDLILKAANPNTWDVFVGVLWKRFGTPLNEINPQTGKPYASGFEAEYQRASQLWQAHERPHIMLYRCIRPIPHQADIEQLKLVQQFFQGIEKRYEVLYKEFDSLDDFTNTLSKHLITVVEKLLKSKPEARVIAFPHSRLFEDIAEETDFSSREHELAEIQNILSTNPKTSILVYAPAGMGKSRLAERLQEVLCSPHSETLSLSFHYIYFDCHIDEKISVSVEELLLAIHQKLPQPRVVSTNIEALTKAISFQALYLKMQKKRLIILLDRIEMMSTACRSFLRREFLPVLQRVVEEPVYYPAVIAFGRIQPREWRGEGSVRFETVELSPFSKAVIEEILRRKTAELSKAEKLNLRFPDQVYGEWAENILNISHGHPRCIVNLISWFYEQHFAISTDFNSKELFLSFVVPVIEREILNDDNLAPLETIDKRSTVTNRLRQVLPYVCVFRFYSSAQLRILANCRLIEENEIDELEKLLRRTFLFDRPLNQLWLKPHPVIRRLLSDALYYQQPKMFTLINQATCEFYDAWISSGGKKQLPSLLDGIIQDQIQIDYIIEGIYHHASTRKRQVSITFLKNKLLSYLRSLRGNYPVKNLAQLLAGRMLDDDELIQVLQRHGKSDDYQKLLSLVENWEPVTTARKAKRRVKAIKSESPKRLIPFNIANSVIEEPKDTSRNLKVFLCYSSEDSTHVNNLYRRLLRKGIEPWLDKKNLLGGQKWEVEIPKEIRASDVVLICLSRNSITKEGFFQKEIKFALDVAAEMPEEKIFVIPLKLEKCDIPERLGHFHCLDFFEIDGYKRLLKTLQYKANELKVSLTSVAKH